jgi:predicted Zn-dependent peptidase
LIKVTTDSTITAAVDEIDSVNSVALGAWVKVGSRDEAGAIAGASHFIEHLLFKGTEELTAKDIAVIMDTAGGEFNAFTSREHTAFYLRVVRDDLETGIKILTDIITKPAFRESDIETERMVMLEEILHHKDDPSDVCFQNLMSTMFPSDSFGRDIQGDVRTISQMDRDQIYGFWEQNYRIKDIVLVAAGNLDFETISQMGEKIATARPGKADVLRRKPLLGQESLTMENKDTDQIHLAIGLSLFGAKDPQRNSIRIINQIFGGGMSSRLFQEVREKRGLVYSIGSTWMGYSDTGIFAVYGACGPTKINELYKVIKEQLLLLEDITEEEVELAKKHLKADILLNSEDTGSRMARMGSSLSTRDTVVEIKDAIKEIDAVDYEAIKNLAAYLGSQTHYVSLVGPQGQLEAFAKDY